MIKQQLCRVFLRSMKELHLYPLIPDKLFLQLLYRRVFDKELNLENPKTYNEKLQWMKLYGRDPLYTKLVDKYEVKKWVADKIGDQYIIPTLGVWDSFDDIDFEALPNQFVLKCTHDSGGVVIVKDKSKFKINDARRKINTCMKRNYFWDGREWPYKNVKPRIIAEKFMSFGDVSKNDIPDYKFYGFDGKVTALMIATDRQSGHTKFDFFDRDFNFLPFRWGHDHAVLRPSKPENYDQMIEIAEKLSVGFPHVRVDLYNINGKIYFGELTFTHWSGFCPFEPEEWDYKFGSWITLPTVSK